jgi:hypothetical protein
VFESTDRVRRAPHVLWRQLGDGALLTVASDDEFFHLSLTGAAVWERLDGARSLSDVMHSLAESFDAPAEAMFEDVRTLLQSLDERGWIEMLSDA